MAGMYAVEPGGSTALLGVNFEIDLGKRLHVDPSLALVECGRAQWSWAMGWASAACSLLRIRSVDEMKYAIS